MKRSATLERWVGSLAAALVVLALAVLASQRLGGPVSVVTIKGNSMEPGLRAGDLVVTLDAGDYNVGDAVAYRSDKLNAIVLHRIVDRAGDRFVFKGDNNSWIDPEKPTTEHLVGRRWVRIPSAGRLLAPLGRPAILAALVALSAFGVLAAGRPPNRARHRLSGTGGARASLSLPAVGLGVAAALFAGIGLFGVVPGGASPEGKEPAYRHTGVFSYRGDAPTSPVYQDGEISTGEPVFLAVARDIEVSFDYAFESETDHAVDGTASLVAEVGDGSGWAYEFPLAGEERIVGGKHHLSATLEPGRARRLVNRVQALTGVAITGYTLKVVPRVEVTGTVGDAHIAESFAPELVFQLDAFKMSLVPTATDAAAGPLRPAQSGGATGPDAGATPGPLGLAPERWKLLLLVAAVVCAGGAAAIATGVLAVGDDDEHGRVARRHGVDIVPVAALLAPESGATVDVGSMEGLVRLADQHGGVVLRAESGGTPTFVVQHEAVSYRFIPHPAASTGAPVPRDVPPPPSRRGRGRPPPPPLPLPLLPPRLAAARELRRTVSEASEPAREPAARPGAPMSVPHP